MPSREATRKERDKKALRALGTAVLKIGSMAEQAFERALAIHEEQAKRDHLVEQARKFADQK